MVELCAAMHITKTTYQRRHKTSEKVRWRTFRQQFLYMAVGLSGARKFWLFSFFSETKEKLNTPARHQLLAHWPIQDYAISTRLPYYARGHFHGSTARKLYLQ